MSRINGFIGRRELLKLVGFSGVAMAMPAEGIAATTISSVPWYTQPALAAVAQDTEPVSPDAALKRLLDGNQRFVQQKREYPHQTQARLQEVAQVQHPFATILSCADSRVSAEILFDQGIGDLFDIRIAGNIVIPEALGSIEYAAVLLNTPLIMVLGHERCGAVTASVKGESLPGEIGTFVKAIKPAMAKVKDKPGDPVENAVVANVQYQVERLQENSALLGQLMQAGTLKIVGGRYDLDTGEVTIV
ncbi:carbonic anhydrase [Komarekiella sp. 'clone 1']|uniref:carbonic anhydrase n=1 Tax=Komarekiella delphini-convector SJRDD-AB1 TaxID=2593771 RepID=A0AA40VTH9_9NOST|nr:carbonic anhydrase [Komarekiella delphini-convector]MBD6619215.1 carbonic anhydrase [Komarekiella delphini-convector SJRDD-AB1]